ncbi:hypothetical protein CAEBREN_11380 [Caenorhabditis brenneri]|uniref:Serpentine Receptor, class Z n=1 Tax=Caenorhabditis brenneri TaxID=135651 RepID=G0N1E1_CAEBE|nr:hypothetical protein CAEBREN_11380 [Caenorhabditis brenneri]
MKNCTTNGTECDPVPWEPVIVYGLYLVPLAYFAIFPFYVRVYRRNREQDKSMAVFPIFEHFYLANWVTYILILIAFVCYNTFGFLELQELTKELTIRLLVLITVPAMWTWNVCQFLLSLLAIQRFFLVFFPATEKYLNFSSRTMKRIIRICYGTIILKFVPFVILQYFGYEELTKSVNDVTHFVLDNLPIATASLYIPLILKIRKSSHLASAQLNRPQRYVFWQLIVISIQRLIFVPVMFFVFSSPSSNPFTSLFSTYLNIFCIPFITQISYLGCNRRTVELLLESLTADNFLKMLCCPCFKPSLARVDVVGETPVIYHVSSTQMDS